MERVVEVPEIQVQTVERHVPVVQVQEIVKEVHIPQIQTVEKIVHIPQIQTVERTVEVPTLSPTTVVAPAQRVVPQLPATTVVAPTVRSMQVVQAVEAASYDGLATSVGALRLTVIKAINLRDADWLPGGGKSDPYVQVEIPGKPHATWKTRVVNSNTNPMWNETHEFALWAPGDQLIFTVFDSDPMKRDDVLGKVVLRSEQFYPQGIAGDLLLEGTRTKVQSFLTINIQFGSAGLAYGQAPMQFAQAPMAEPVAMYR